MLSAVCKVVREVVRVSGNRPVTVIYLLLSQKELRVVRYKA